MNGGRKSSKRKKSREYCSENADISGGNFLISYEEDNAEREGERERERGNEKDEKKDRKKERWRSQKSKD